LKYIIFQVPNPKIPMDRLYISRRNIYKLKKFDKTKLFSIEHMFFLYQNLENQQNVVNLSNAFFILNSLSIKIIPYTYFSDFTYLKTFICYSPFLALQDRCFNEYSSLSFIFIPRIVSSIGEGCFIDARLYSR
jgi:hypothetical protein